MTPEHAVTRRARAAAPLTPSRRPAPLLVTSAARVVQPQDERGVVGRGSSGADIRAQVAAAQISPVGGRRPRLRMGTPPPAAAEKPVDGQGVGRGRRAQTSHRAVGVLCARRPRAVGLGGRRRAAQTARQLHATLSPRPRPRPRPPPRVCRPRGRTRRRRPPRLVPACPPRLPRPRPTAPMARPTVAAPRRRRRHDRGGNAGPRIARGARGGSGQAVRVVRQLGAASCAAGGSDGADWRHPDRPCRVDGRIRRRGSAPTAGKAFNVNDVKAFNRHVCPSSKGKGGGSQRSAAATTSTRARAAAAVAAAAGEKAAAAAAAAAALSDAGPRPPQSGRAGPPCFPQGVMPPVGLVWRYGGPMPQMGQQFHRRAAPPPGDDAAGRRSMRAHRDGAQGRG